MKKLLLIIAIPITLMVITLFALIFFVNPNQFKPLIVDQVQKSTGFEVAIEGDISWTFFPHLGLSVGRAELRNPEGFSSPNILKVEQIGLAIEVAPLLNHQLNIGNILLDGAEIWLETRKDGRSNLDSITKLGNGRTEPAKVQTQTDMAQVSLTPKTNVETSQDKKWRVSVAGITVSNAQVTISDKEVGSLLTLNNANASLYEFAFGQWSKIEFDVSGKNQQQRFAAKGETELYLSEDLSDPQIRKLMVDGTFSDPQNKVEQFRLDLETFVFDKANDLSYKLDGNFAGMDIDSKGSLSIIVDKAMSKIQIQSINLSNQLEGGSLPQSPMKMDVYADIIFDVKKSRLALSLTELTANDVVLDGKASVVLSKIPEVNFDLHSSNIDLDTFLGLNDPSKQTSTSGHSEDNVSSENTDKVEKAEFEPDLTAMRLVNAKGTVVIDKFKANNAKLQNLTTQFTLKNGVLDLSRFSADLYEGSISTKAKLDARKSIPLYSINGAMKGVKIQPLINDVIDNNILEGTGNIDMAITGRSLKPTALKENLNGNVEVRFTDGSIYGVNLPHLIRTNYARFKGKNASVAKNVEKTDFSAMTATLKLNKGIVSTNNLNMQSPLLRITGKGNANYIKQNVDFLIRTSIVGSLKGQGGETIQDLKDVTIPVEISGAWVEPKFKLVFDDVLKQKVKKEAERGIKKLLGDKVKPDQTKEITDKLLKSLFN